MEINNPIINLEFPLSRRGIPAKNKVNLGQDQSFIEGTFLSNLPLAVNLANNHIMDYGESAFNDTLDRLDEMGIKYFGAGFEKDNYHNPLLIRMKDKIFCISGYCCRSTHPAYGDSAQPSAAPLFRKRVFHDIVKYRKKCDFMVIAFHWGEEQIPFPKPEDVEIAHGCIDLGADLIIGHHAHVIQSIETYNGKYIFYGLGNFLFPDTDAPSDFDGKQYRNRLIVRQQPKNLRSIVVGISSELTVSYQVVVFHDGVVRPLSSHPSIPRWIPRSKKAFDLLYTWTRRVQMIKYFIQRPRIPSPSQINRWLSM